MKKCVVGVLDKYKLHNALLYPLNERGEIVFVHTFVIVSNGNQLEMDIMLEAFLPNEGGVTPDDIPKTEETIWILGTEYKPPHDVKAIRAHIRSILWFTYREDFDPIGETGYTSDSGWGCMLRCGQMMLARAYMTYYMGADWIWTPQTQVRTYLRILRTFEDRQTERYSIHRIALIGAQEGKKVGQWFGPNTVAQVLKRLTLDEYWTKLVVHVALHNMVIINEVTTSFDLWKSFSIIRSSGREMLLFFGITEFDCMTRVQQPEDNNKPSPRGPWSPLLLIIPLLLGIKTINSNYLEQLKRCFTLKYSMGILGGTLFHALYLIGCVGDEVFFLDPHTTQKTAPRVVYKTKWQQVAADETYHCDHAMRRKLSKLDPSLALGFLCKTEDDFDSLCKQLQEKKIASGDRPLFQIFVKKPSYMMNRL